MNVIARLDEVCNIIMGQAPSGDAYNTRGDGWPLIAGAGDFRGSLPGPRKFTTVASKLSKPGDIILGIRASIGDKVLSDGEYCLGRGVAALRPKLELDQRFLWQWLSHNSTSLASKGKGATFKQVNRQDIGEMPIRLPPLPLQRRIAQVLDNVDTLRAKRHKAITLLDDLAQSIFLDMFGDPDQSWSRATVGNVARDAKGAIRTGPFGSQLLHDEFVDSGVSVLGIDNAVANEFQWRGRRFITKEKYKKLVRYTVYPGDVLITIMGTCGRCAIVPDDIPVAINTKHLCCITLDRSRCLPEFLHSYFLIHPDARRYLSRTAKGAIMDGLNMAIVKGLPITLPPIDLQQAFVGRMRAERAVKVTHTAHLAELDALFASLQRRAFRGELWVDSPAA